MTDHDLQFARDQRTLSCVAAGIWAIVTLWLAAYSVSLSFGTLAFGAYLARQAVLSQKRIDSLHARALAADLAEGADGPVLAEAA